MREARGDLWTLPADVRAVTTNGVYNARSHAIMGGGCAREARERYPGMAHVLGKLLRNSGNHVYILHESPEDTVVSFPTKYHYREKASLPLIEQSCRELMSLADRHGTWHDILIPRPGCGLGGLRYEDVRPVLAEVLDDRAVVITP